LLRRPAHPLPLSTRACLFPLQLADTLRRDNPRLSVREDEVENILVAAVKVTPAPPSPPPPSTPPPFTPTPTNLIPHSSYVSRPCALRRSTC